MTLTSSVAEICYKDEEKERYPRLMKCSSYTALTNYITSLKDICPVHNWTRFAGIESSLSSIGFLNLYYYYLNRSSRRTTWICIFFLISHFPKAEQLLNQNL